MRNLLMAAFFLSSMPGVAYGHVDRRELSVHDFQPDGNISLNDRRTIVVVRVISIFDVGAPPVEHVIDISEYLDNEPWMLNGVWTNNQEQQREFEAAQKVVYEWNTLMTGIGLFFILAGILSWMLVLPPAKTDNSKMSV